ncbi:suppressor APC domain-containing protein 1 isoform X1 [Alosa sapidissima]|uniref:suppressor APC domain-containing protein 1 isoform X1 n=1 Tax=Alosa sapidissima TaxID=34773 RepID=UPI001C096975|nr:suppressor APC domain-containing protein 1 isoform X1 [Alosa sapidissima]
MACGAAYTVVILPLQNSRHSLEGLHFYLWLRELKALEQEKDCLWLGLQSLDRTRLWYQQSLLQNHIRTADLSQNMCEESDGSSCLLRCELQRVNGTLGNLMSDASAWSSASDWDHRWQHTLLTQMVSRQNLHISSLQLDKDMLESQCVCVQCVLEPVYQQGAL